MGAVLHTLNLRLHPTEIGYIASHAEDRVVIVDRSLLPLFEKFAAQVPIASSTSSSMPDERRRPPEGTLDYEALLARESDDFDWPTLDENAPRR